MQLGHLLLPSAKLLRIRYALNPVAPGLSHCLLLQLSPLLTGETTSKWAHASLTRVPAEHLLQVVA